MGYCKLQQWKASGILCFCTLECFCRVTFLIRKHWVDSTFKSWQLAKPPSDWLYQFTIPLWYFPYILHNFVVWSVFNPRVSGSWIMTLPALLFHLHSSLFCPPATRMALTLSDFWQGLPFSHQILTLLSPDPWPWASFILSLSFSFLISKMGLIRVSPSLRCFED